MKKLDSVHNVEVRYVIEASRGSPAQGLYCEAGMTSLHLRRQSLLLRYVAKIVAVPSHMNHVLIANNRLAMNTTAPLLVHWAFGIRAIEISRR